MWLTLLTLAPVGLVLGLLTFGRYGTHVGLEPTPLRIAWATLATVLLGPVAVAQLGFFYWLAAIIALVTVLAMFAAWRSPQPPLNT